MKFPESMVRNLMKENTNFYVSTKSVVEVDRILTSIVKDLVESATIIAFKSGRTTISERDIAIAEQNLYYRKR